MNKKQIIHEFLTIEPKEYSFFNDKKWRQKLEFYIFTKLKKDEIKRYADELIKRLKDDKDNEWFNKNIIHTIEKNLKRLEKGNMWIFS